MPLAPAEEVPNWIAGTGNYSDPLHAPSLDRLRGLLSWRGHRALAETSFTRAPRSTSFAEPRESKSRSQSLISLTLITPGTGRPLESAPERWRFAGRTGKRNRRQVCLTARGGIGDTGAMSTRLDAAPDDEQVRLEVELVSDDPLGQLRGLRAATRQLDAWQREAIARARERGASWSDIGDALGVTKQAAWSSFNQDVREALSSARGRSGLDDEDAQQLADEARTERNRGASSR